jgi:hypothetical protein
MQSVRRIVARADDPTSARLFPLNAALPTLQGISKSISKALRQSQRSLKNCSKQTGVSAI